MTAHDFLDDDQRDQLAELAFGTLAEAPARALHQHIAQCRACRNEFETVSEVATDLALAAPGSAPAPEVWDRVRYRILERARTPPELGETPPAAPGFTDPADVQLWRRWSSTPSPAQPFTNIAASEGDWQTTAIEGIEVRRLFLDAAAKRVTLLARMAPHTAYPAHVHAGPEECFVLSGDLRVGDLHLHAGDFQRAEPGSTHVVQSTDEGCVLLLVSSTEDAFLR
ncbi:MAG: cupin domain-containing protein [Planctomycetota bacterium]